MTIPREKLKDYWWFRFAKGIYVFVWIIFILIFFSAIDNIFTNDFVLLTFVVFAGLLIGVRYFFLYVVSGNKK